MKKLRQRRTICYCFEVSEAEIRTAIQAHALTTVDEVAEYTNAGMGCRTCRWDIEDILTDELAQGDRNG